MCTRNGGTSEIAENINMTTIGELIEFAKKEEIDLTVVGPEVPLVEGIVDAFQEEGLRIFGVDKKSARLEGSKIYSKWFMEEYKIPTASYMVSKTFEEARKALDSFTYPLVIKADGLCAGKGVVICQDKKEGIETLESFFDQKVFGNAGTEVVIEEFLEGVEASLLCFVSKGRILPMESAKDYKKIFEGDLGPNTGGVGCYSPSPLFNRDLKDKIRKEVLDKIEEGFRKENLDYTGILFIGFMIGEDLNVLEFNVRFGDPETEVVLPRLRSDLYTVLNKTIDGELTAEDLVWDERKAMTVVLTSEGYPEKPIVDRKIDISKLDEEIILFHNGTKIKNGDLYTAGGRVLSATTLGTDMKDMRDRVYENIEKINFQGICYRKDIGKF